MTTATDSNLVRHAERELRLAGMYDEDADYGPGAIADHVLDIVRLFASGGHSGGSAAMTLDIIGRLLAFKTLTPLTSDPEDWMEVGDGMWQSKRRPDAFSTDGGQTWYCLDEPKDERLVPSDG